MRKRHKSPLQVEAQAVFHTDADRSLFLLETEAEKGEFRSGGGCLP